MVRKTTVCRRDKYRLGFTLIELIVVIALIMVLIGGVGVLSRGGTEAVSVTSAQSSLAALFTSAKLQASSSGRDVLVMVDLYPGVVGSQTQLSPNPGYLRRFIVFRRTDNTGDEYVRSGREVYLPDGVYVVPPTSVAAPITGSNVGNLRFRWASDGSVRRSTSGGGSLTQYGAAIPTNITPVEAANQFYGWRVSPDGRISSLGSTAMVGQMSSQIVLVPGVRASANMPDNAGFRVNIHNGHGAKGVRISYYGQVSMVNNLAAFD